MGDAKRRGTLEQRKAEAIKREVDRVRSLPLRRNTHSPKHLAMMVAAVGALASASSSAFKRKPISEMTLEDFG